MSSRAMRHGHRRASVLAVALSILSWGGGATADAVGKTASPAASRTYCVTRYGSGYPHPVPTEHHTTRKTVTPTIYITYTPTVTTTGSTSTLTTSSTTTFTDSSSTTFFATSTVTATTTTTTTTTAPVSTATETETDTTTSTTTSTTVVPTTPGFVPIQTSVPDGTYNGAGGGPSQRKRRFKRRVASAGEPEYEPLEARTPSKKLKPELCKAHPQSVDCSVTITSTAAAVTHTQTAATTITITPSPSTVTHTATLSTTITTTINEGTATATSTTTTTETDTATDSPSTTTTTTTTVTVGYVATSTSYAECGYNNFINQIHGQSGVFVYSANGQNPFNQITGPSNALECCDYCAGGGSSNCGAAIWSSASGGCFTNSGCTAEYEAYADPGVDYVIMNGCVAVTAYS